jgi:alkaline phosphatase D
VSVSFVLEMRTFYQSMKTFLVASLVAFVAIASAAAELPSVHSDFSNGTVDGWKPYSGGDPGSTVAWSSTVENTHHLKLTEGAIGGKDYFEAPAKFTGDKAIYYGGTLSFDIRVSDASNPTTWRDDVVLIGANNTRLIYTFSSRPTVAWGSRTISLEIGEWLL